MCGDRDDSIVQPSVDVVIPVLNEAHVIESSVATLREFFAAHTSYAWRIVIVENGSTDDTAAIGARLATQFDDVDYLELGRPGRGRALRKAWRSARASMRGRIRRSRRAASSSRAPTTSSCASF